ncbi:class I SAM-dependent methyltransferase [Ramlibacter rhizophilus]|nr:class I SAM-dependent methyltransferase [Ramlibacter rhizophilus]
MHAGPLDWPAGGIEVLGRCPVCYSNSRELLHEQLLDRLFGTPGLWTLHRCECGVAYLDPRPRSDFLYLAYRDYYTHQRQDEAAGIASLMVRAKALIRRQYVGAKYGVRTRHSPGYALLRLFPAQTNALDAFMRHIPMPWGGRRLLDVGCGDGMFLAHAQLAGWNVMGTELDARAAAQAKSRGVEVFLGKVEDLLQSGVRFEQITLSHVIEHVADPRAILSAVRSLLVPGGACWIETPNIDAYGHQLFGPAWRGLEPPRHLQLFTRERLRLLCEAVGFQAVEDAPWHPDGWVVLEASMKLARQLDLKIDKGEIKKLRYFGSQDPEKREFITLCARC